MGVVELIGLAQGETANVIALNESNIAILTGYLLIAYFTGANLTVFQVSFVNTVFILTRVATFFSMKGVLERAQHFTAQVYEVDPKIPVGPMVTGGYGGVVQATMFTFLTIGALVFMWQVRHTKTE